MNSSISASDIEDSALWRRWLLAFFAATAAVAGALYLFVLIMDPFASGKLTPIQRIDHVSGNRIYANSARMRDPQFDAATLGNSHAVRLAPEALDRETGRRFAMLAVEGTWPDEHMFLMQQFARRHPSPFFVVVLDDEWCSPKVEHGVIVPRWLYDESRLRYASRILSNFALRSAWRRLMVMAGLEKPVRADGYDARPRRPWSDDRMRRIMETMPPNIWGDVEAPYPYFDKLERLLPEFSPSTSILFVFVPVFSKYLPAPNSNADTRLKACKERANTIARTRPRTAMLDLRVDGPKVRDIDNFSDVTHYNEDIARDIEVAIRQRIVEMQRAAPR